MMWDRASYSWTGFWCGVMTAFSYCMFNLVQPGDEATAKAFAFRWLDVFLWGPVLAVLPELVGIVMKTGRRLFVAQSSNGKSS